MQAFSQQPAGVIESKVEISINKNFQKTVVIHYENLETKTTTYRAKPKMRHIDIRVKNYQ